MDLALEVVYAWLWSFESVIEERGLISVQPHCLWNFHLSMIKMGSVLSRAIIVVVSCLKVNFWLSLVVVISPAILISEHQGVDNVVWLPCSSRMDTGVVLGFGVLVTLMI